MKWVIGQLFRTSDGTLMIRSAGGVEQVVADIIEAERGASRIIIPVNDEHFTRQTVTVAQQSPGIICIATQPVAQRMDSDAAAIRLARWMTLEDEPDLSGWYFIAHRHSHYTVRGEIIDLVPEEQPTRPATVFAYKNAGMPRVEMKLTELLRLDVHVALAPTKDEADLSFQQHWDVLLRRNDYG
ncbi:MAG: hypothetical protein WCP91_02660 [Candidatus Berkelbacteria bacterium]